MKRIVKKLRPKGKRKQQEAPTNSRITNETVAAHREEVLAGARKYIYPLQHSKHRLVVISITLLLVAVVAFFSYCVLALYKFKSSSNFLHNVTKVIPFPIARSGSDFVAYENYLFEVKHYTHYYQSQQELDINSEQGQSQLAEFKKRALKKVTTDAYVKELAQQNGVSVSDNEVNDAITVLRNQNRLGASDKEFETVLRDFWGWSINDFKRSLKQQQLAQKVVSKLDTDTHARAEKALAKLKAGKDFVAVAKESSEDPASRESGGEYGFLIEKTNRDVPHQVIEALFNLETSQYSEIIDVGYGLEIVKNIEPQDNKIRASHVVFNFKNIDSYVGDLKEKKKTRTYIKL